MEKDNIKCPKCGTEITIDQAIVQRIVNNQVKIQVEKDRFEIEEKLKKEFSEVQNKDMLVLKEKLAVAEKDKSDSIAKEIDFIKKEQELADKLKRQELIIAQKLKEERLLVEEKVRKEEIDKNQSIISEMRKQLDDTKKSLIEAQRKAQQGSMQTQGEVMELALEELLKQNFPSDEISPVAKGVKGADIMQTVKTSAGAECGTIVWESKQTKAWTEEWVQKLKDDGRNVKGNMLVLVSDVLPKSISSFGVYKGVWLTKYASVIGLTHALRNQLIAIFNVAQSQENKDDKKEIMYNYLTSPAFATKIESLVDNFVNMKTTLDREKLVISKSWSARELQINRMMDNTVKIYTDIQGVAGNSFPKIDILELESGLDDLEKVDDIQTKKPHSKNNLDSKNQENLF